MRYYGCFFFFFKQKTAYEMRISDWSSDVCSSDLIERAADPALVAGINEGLAPCFAATPLCEGNFYGPRTNRFGALLRRSPAMAQLVMHEQVLAMVEAALLPWCDRIALNLTQAIEIHPGALPQLPHRDQDMWAGPKGTPE